ncbi:MAG: alpha/beta fold hydrolase, partial [Deltaproteobacteria bacterium]
MSISRPSIKTFVLPEGGIVDRSVPIHRTPGGIEFVRTPDERFAGLSGYPFAPHWVEIDGLRVHYVEEGPADGPLVVLVHGQPTWSYLYRKMIPILAAAGLRVIAWDNVGFGRSDKPIDPKVHTYARHVGWYHAILNALALRDVTLFCQDWGGVIGLRDVGDSPARFAR